MGCRCVICRQPLDLEEDELPCDATCPGCGLRHYVTEDGRLGAYWPDESGALTYRWDVGPPQRD